MARSYEAHRRRERAPSLRRPRVAMCDCGRWIMRCQPYRMESPLEWRCYSCASTISFGAPRKAVKPTRS
jgi:hypothetical protein